MKYKKIFFRFLKEKNSYYRFKTLIFFHTKNLAIHVSNPKFYVGGGFIWKKDNDWLGMLRNTWIDFYNNLPIGLKMSQEEIMKLNDKMRKERWMR